MKAMIRPAVSLFVALTVVTGVAYPLAVTAVAKAAFPKQAQGSLIIRNGKPVGSSLIGQNFTDPEFFWGRPSATSPMAYNGQGSGGSNLGPLNPALTDAVKGRVDALRAADPEMPKPQKEHEWLQQLVGEWDTEAEILEEPGKPPALYTGDEGWKDDG